jgi:hypothetical protein
MTQDRNTKIRTAITTVVQTLEDQDLDFGDALTALSYALIVSAKGARISKEEFLQNLELEWDHLGDIDEGMEQ